MKSLVALTVGVGRIPLSLVESDYHRGLHGVGAILRTLLLQRRQRVHAMLLKSIGRILVKYGVKIIGNAAVFGVGGDALLELWDLWSKSKQDQRQKREEVEQLAVQSQTEARQSAAEVAEQVAGDQPETVRQAVAAYLSQLPNAIRQSQIRPQDPTGRTVSSQLRLSRPEDLLLLLPARLPRFKVGDRPAGVGDRELVELLGMGGFGEVWKAINPYMAQAVALKFCLDPAAAKMLKNEARVLGQVMGQGQHPSIVQLRNTYLAAEVPCLEYEFVSGGDLTSLAYRLLHQYQGKLPVQLVTNLMRNIIRGVRHAHRLTPPIVHRDLKPANILVQPKPNGKVELRVADFGIGGVAAVCALDQTPQGSAPGQYLTTGLRGACTPLYCSPQQAHGEPPDPRDDVHALGVIWYQLLVGDLNVAAGTDWHYEVAARQVPEAITGLLGRCLSSNAERRPADAGVLADELDKIVHLGPGNGDKKPPSPFEPDMKEALDERRKKGTSRAYFEQHGPVRVGAWRPASENGDAAAQWLLACCLQEGAGTPKDTQAALSWLQRAADGGLAVAQTDLGDCYYPGGVGYNFLGQGVEADANEAFRLYTAAAAQGFAEAQVDLGDCYWEGKGVAKDLAEAARHYRKAAEADWARGQDSLGYCYFEGSGVEQDYPQAIGWYRKAAEQGLASAQNNLGACYERGKGVKKNWGEAAKWYRKAADQGNVDAQFNLGYCFHHGYGVEQDLAQAKQWYRKAAEQGHRRAKNALRQFDEEGSGKAPGPEDEDAGEDEDTKGYWVIAPYSADPPEQWEQVWEFDLANNIISVGWTQLGDISSLNEEGLRRPLTAPTRTPRPRHRRGDSTSGCSGTFSTRSNSGTLSSLGRERRGSPPLEL